VLQDGCPASWQLAATVAKRLVAAASDHRAGAQKGRLKTYPTMTGIMFGTHGKVVAAFGFGGKSSLFPKHNI